LKLTGGSEERIDAEDSNNCMKINLLDYFDKLFDVNAASGEQLVINDNIFSEFETHIQIEKHRGMKVNESVVFDELELVELTWINSPSDFYVMRQADIIVLERIENELTLLEESADVHCIKVGAASVDDLVAFKENDVFIRARILSLADGIAKLKYIDEGAEGYHSLTELYTLPVQLASVPGLAHHCSLSGVTPPRSVWSSEARLLLAAVTKDMYCMVSVRGLTTRIMVELFTQPAKGVSSDDKCSLSSYLVYKEVAKLEGDCNFESKNVYQKSFIELAYPSEGSKYTVVVSHIEHPGRVFVQFGNVEYLKPLTEEMKVTYQERKEEIELHVLIPNDGMACVVCVEQFGGYEEYLRAKIINVLDKGRVEVVYVDYGHKEIITDSQVFKILDRFLALPVMAIPVCMDNVGFLEGKKHLAQALREKTLMKELVMCVTENKGDDYCRVVFYETTEEGVFCVNDWLSAEGQFLALSDISYTMNIEILDRLEKGCLFDSHCHLDFILLQRLSCVELDSFDQFLQRYPVMKHSSLEGYITNFCSPELWLEHLLSPGPLMHSLISCPSVFYTIGCHPHFANLLNEDTYEEMETLIRKSGSNFVAVGECGLDRSRKNITPMSDQIEAFKKQLQLAMTLKKPLVLHIRDAEEEALEVLNQVGLSTDWPIHRHCWNDTWEICKAWLERFNNSVVGITALITFPHMNDLRKVVKMLPLSRLVLETDAPYFLPRGGGTDSLLGHTREFSLPVHVANVAAQVAAIRDCSVETVLEANRKNIKRTYRI